VGKEGNRFEEVATGEVTDPEEVLIDYGDDAWEQLVCPAGLLMGIRRIARETQIAVSQVADLLDGCASPRPATREIIAVTAWVKVSFTCLLFAQATMPVLWSPGLSELDRGLRPTSGRLVSARPTDLRRVMLPTLSGLLAREHAKLGCALWVRDRLLASDARWLRDRSAPQPTLATGNLSGIHQRWSVPHS
jgi:hypothetical protein